LRSIDLRSRRRTDAQPSRPVWVFLVTPLVALESPDFGVGKAWISLDSLVRNETYQCVIRTKPRKFFSTPFCRRERPFESASRRFGMAKGAIAHWAILNQFLIFCNSLSALLAVLLVWFRLGRMAEMIRLRAEDFSAWLSEIAGMSAEQRLEAVQALAKADREAGALGEGASSGRGGKRGRRVDAWSDERCGVQRDLTPGQYDKIDQVAV
jgi:hypothetical protein